MSGVAGLARRVWRDHRRASRLSHPSQSPLFPKLSLSPCEVIPSHLFPVKNALVLLDINLHTVINAQIQPPVQIIISIRANQQEGRGILPVSFKHMNLLRPYNHPSAHNRGDVHNFPAAILPVHIPTGLASPVIPAGLAPAVVSSGLATLIGIISTGLASAVVSSGLATPSCIIPAGLASTVSSGTIITGTVCYLFKVI